MQITVRSFADHGGEAGGAHVTDLPEILTLVDLGDVYLYGRDRHGFQRVEQRDRRMRIRAGVDHDAVDLIEIGLLDPVDECAFMIGLKCVKLNAFTFCILRQLVQQRGIGLRTVDRRLADAEHIQVRAVDDQQSRRMFFCHDKASPFTPSSLQLR